MSQPFHHTGNSQEGNNQPIFGPAAREDEVSLRSYIRRSRPASYHHSTLSLSHTRLFSAFPHWGRPCGLFSLPISIQSLQQRVNQRRREYPTHPGSIQRQLSLSLCPLASTSRISLEVLEELHFPWMCNATELISQPCLSLPPCLASP